MPYSTGTREGGVDDRQKQLLTAAAGLGAAATLQLLARRRRSFHFRGRTVLITGGSRGLGLVLAREFAAEGARLVICARDREELERAGAELAGGGAEVLAVPCDVTERAQVQDLVAAALERFGQVDVLVNNAGVIQVGPMEAMTLADYEQAMKVHFWGPLYTMLAVLPGMRARRAGRIVNISSIGGKIPFPHLLPYNASKHALVGLSGGMRAELASQGVLVTTVCPGLMRTGSPVNAWFKGQHRAEYAWFTLGDSLPVASISAERAARQIVSACRRGDAELIISLPARLAVVFHGIAPGLTLELLSAVDRLLPEPGGTGTVARTGRESESPLTLSALTGLTRQAARAHNQEG
jgi:NAD(P)-dependent dehydrogenase (short-subunit alcohol dehydrogenase family)